MINLHRALRVNIRISLEVRLKRKSSTRTKTFFESNERERDRVIEREAKPINQLMQLNYISCANTMCTYAAHAQLHQAITICYRLRSFSFRMILILYSMKLFARMYAVVFSFISWSLTNVAHVRLLLENY